MRKMKQTQRHNNKAQNKVNISFANEWSKTNGFFIFILVLQISGGALCVCAFSSVSTFYFFFPLFVWRFCCSGCGNFVVVS